MQANVLKVLDRNSCLLHANVKRKKETLDDACMVQLCNESNKLSKQRKLNGCANDFYNSFCPLRKSIGRYYLNFMKSGIPQRVMFYENGQWMDFPQTVIGFVREDVRMKKATIEVHCGGFHCLLDFLHMCHVDLETGLQQPIAWIDEAGSCFFPELSAHENCEHLYAENQYFMQRELKLQIEVDLAGIYNSKIECSGESDTPNKEMPKSAINRMFVEHEADHNREVDVKVKKNPVFPSGLDFSCAALDFDTVQKMLRRANGLELVDFYACFGTGLQDRLELFDKQVEIVNKYRGNANVCYAWLPTSEKSMSTLTTYGIRFYELPTIKPIFGSGIQLAAVDSSHISASFCDVDEEGIRHMLLCRVILGNTELVQVGSTQCHPSSEDFDSGVDDLQNPMLYVVWTMNMTTHIFPECVVSFKVPNSAEGAWKVNLDVRNSSSQFQSFNCANKLDGKIFDVDDSTLTPISHFGNIIGNQRPVAASGVNVKGTEGDVQVEASAIHSGYSSNHGFDNSVNQGKAPSMGSGTPKAPRSPWMPFPTLLAAISDEIKPKDMAIINHQYALFKDRHISRGDFVKKLRSVAGDSLLRSTITRLQCKIFTYLASKGYPLDDFQDAIIKALHPFSNCMQHSALLDELLPSIEIIGGGGRCKVP